MKDDSSGSGCLSFGLIWSVVFVVSFFAVSVGDPAPIDCGPIPDCDPYPPRWSDYLFPIELAILVVGGWFFYRSDMKDGDD